MISVMARKLAALQGGDKLRRRVEDPTTSIFMKVFVDGAGC